MDTAEVLITWNGDVHTLRCPLPCTAALVLEAFLGIHPDLRRPPRLALFTVDGMTELEGHEQVQAGADLVLRPRVIR